MKFAVDQILFRAELPPNFGGYPPGSVVPVILKFKVLKLTKCGAWIEPQGEWHFSKRFITNGTHFVSVDENEALNSLKARVRVWYRHAKWRFARAKRACAAVGVDTEKVDIQSFSFVW